MILSASPTTLQSDMSKSFAFSSRFNYNNIRLIQLLSMNLIRHEINKRNARIKGVQNTAVTLNDFNIGICSDLACRQNAGANRCNLWSVIGNSISLTILPPNAGTMQTRFALSFMVASTQCAATPVFTLAAMVGASSEPTAVAPIRKPSGL